MALPKKLLAPSLPLGSDSFEKRVVNLYAAAANSQTTYQSGDRLLFQFPNYARSFIDFNKSFLKFDLKVTNGAGNSVVRVCDNLPIFERLQVRVGAKNLEDIDSYYSLEKILTNIHKTKEDRTVSQFYGDYANEIRAVDAHGLIPEASIAAIQASTANYTKRLYSGVLNNTDYLFPIHRLNTGNALEIELTLAHNNIALKEVTHGDHSDAKFEISNVKFQLTLLKVSDAFFNKYNQLANNNELVLPMVSYKRHVSNIASGQTEPVVFVNSNAKNLKKTYTVFRNSPSAIGVEQQPVFLKGSLNDPNNQLLRYQYKYMSRNFPEDKVEASKVGDQTSIFMNFLTNTHDNMTNNLPAITRLWSQMLILSQNFTYSEDDMINGLNINASGSPLILEMKFHGDGGT